MSNNIWQSEKPSAGNTIVTTIIDDDTVVPSSGAVVDYVAGMGGGDMSLAGIQSVTGLKTFDKEKIAMQGTSTGTNTISTANTSATNYLNTIPAKSGTFAMTTDITGTNSGTNTGDETTETIKTKLGSADTDTDGYLISTDWNTFNNANNAVTEALTVNGFIDSENITVSFVNNTRTFIITPSTSFTYYSDGLQYSKTIEENIVISNTEGLHYIYYNGATLSETTTFVETLITHKAIIAIIYWDVTNQKQIYFGREYYHTPKMGGKTHSYHHQTTGYILESGGELANILPDQNGDSDTHAQVGNTATVAWDEDAKFTLSARNSTSIMPVYYRSGADASHIWRINETTTFPILTAGTGRAAYNLLSTGTWSLAEIPDNNYTLAHIAATNDTDRPFIAIVNQNYYSSVTLARDAAEVAVNSIIVTGLPFAEFKFLGTLIFQTRDVYTNTVNSRILSTNSGASYIDLRQTVIGRNGLSSIVTDHNVLANRDVAGNHSKIVPLIDSTNAFSVYKADGITTMMKFDTTNESSIIYSTNNERFIVDSTGISCYGDFTIGDGNTQTAATFPVDITTQSIVLGDIDTYGNNTKITIDDANSQVVIKNKLNLDGGIIKPTSNSTTAIQITKVDETSIFNVDTTNNRVGINTTTPSVALEVNGTTKTTSIEMNNQCLISNSLSNLTTSGISTILTVGEDVSFGNVLYIKSDGKLWKADTSGTDTYPVLYMATETKTADSTCNVLKYGYANNTSWSWTIGGMLYLSTTGQITQTQPSTTDYIVQVIGIAINATTIHFNPQLSLIKIA